MDLVITRTNLGCVLRTDNLASKVDNRELAKNESPVRRSEVIYQNQRKE